MKKKMSLTAGAVLGASVLAAGAIHGRSSALRPAAAVARPARPAEVAADGRVVTYPGGEVVVGAERAGRLVRLLVDEGDVVSKGQLLGELEGDALRAALAESRARVSEAEAEARLADLTLRRREDLARE